MILLILPAREYYFTPVRIRLLLDMAGKEVTSNAEIIHY